MKKSKIIIVLAAVTLVVALYAVTWLRVYTLTADYFAQAEGNFEKGKFALALKGGNDFATGGFIGSYQQVLEAWEGKMVFPRPAIYQSALDRVETIFAEKFTVKDIDAMVKKSLKVDKKYLDQSLVRKAEILLAEGKTEKAIEAYQSVIEIFPKNKELATEIQQKLAELEAN